jgi:hypothetical protein
MRTSLRLGLLAGVAEISIVRVSIKNLWFLLLNLLKERQSLVMIVCAMVTVGDAGTDGHYRNYKGNRYFSITFTVARMDV